MKTSPHRKPKVKRAKSSARSARPAKVAPKKRQPTTPRNGSAVDLGPAAGGSTPRFPVVGIGASAGGLEALEQFLKAVPEASGMAYIVIQHLDPTHKGAMVELLQRHCAMPVVEVTDRLRIKPDCVYVIPPNKNMSILRGTLHLVPQDQPRGLNLPIDFFFRALADDQQERSVGVILSGMGSDGTLGLRAIKGKDGAGFVQSPTLAKFDGMPRSAIEAGLADVVAAAEELPARIAAYHRHAPDLRGSEVQVTSDTQSALEKVLIMLRTRTGHDFSLYKKSTVYRRIERRMSLHQLEKIANYVRYLRETPAEIEILFQELLIGVTSFFRDPYVWASLRDEIFPALMRQRAQDGVLRAWVPACSTGEEAYSLAICYKEALEKLRPPRGSTLQVFATDLDSGAVAKARQGIYPANIAADVSPARLRRFFVQDERGYRIGMDIRDMVVFAAQNVIMDPPFTKLDLVSCRNLLIYLAPELQQKLVPLFHHSLRPGGVLVLGSAETMGASTHLFAPADPRTRIYRRRDAALGAAAVEYPAIAGTSPLAASAAAAPAPVPPRPAALQMIAERVIAQRFAPTVLLTTDKGELLYSSRATGKYLQPAIGKATLNIFAMARDGLRYELSRAFAMALRQDTPVTIRGIVVKTNGSAQTIDLTAQKLSDPKELRGTVIVALTDVKAKPNDKGTQTKRRAPLDAHADDLAADLEHARQELQTTREEMQTSQEELKSTNEELQSTNEELQSTNEELTTSKEEMQSMNEELQTLNHELQAKVDELSHSNNDMKNLFNSTDIATLFLDGELRVRRFTTATAKLVKLIPADLGRPITDIASDLDYPTLAEDAQEVLQTLVFSEKQVAAKDGRWFSVRIMPYRTLDNIIDGVVITCTDTTAAKLLERALRNQTSQLGQLADALPNIVWGCRPDGACDFLSAQWTLYTGIAQAKHLGHGWLEQIHPEDRDRVREAWQTALRSGGELNTECRLGGSDGTYRWFKTAAVANRDEDDNVVRWWGTHTDIASIRRGPP